MADAAPARSGFRGGFGSRGSRGVSLLFQFHAFNNFPWFAHTKMTNFKYFAVSLFTCCNRVVEMLVDVVVAHVEDVDAVKKIKKNGFQ